MKVVKFGGSSLASGQQFEKVINILRQDQNRKVIVTSAPGKREETDTKVTDLLINYATLTIETKPTNIVTEQLFNRYLEIANHFGLEEDKLQTIKEKIENLQYEKFENNDYLMASFKAHGERLNAKLMALILNHLGIRARFLDPEKFGFYVSDSANNAQVLDETYANIEALNLTDELLIVPGFFGITKDHKIATFSRGGSDITGAILSKGFHASCYENFTDVDAIYAANPNTVKNPYAITKMTYRELRELSYAGFSVFHDEAIIPAIEANITINVKNTNHSELPGTLIVPEANFEPENLVTGVASSDRFAALYLHRYLLNKEVGFTLKLLEILYRYNVSYEHMPSGIDDLTIIFDKSQLTNFKIKQLCQDIKATLQPDEMQWINDYAIIMVVGEGMRDNIGVLDRVISPLAQNNIGIHMINQGASRISVMLGTRQADANLAIEHIYHNFFS
ncbi:aspartate kinase [Holzapfeliella floricola]|uniref:Aspartokinase n=1 Tax=Holzapfeliella floricola DSM 23037 = JCM 16512 TaxID=1423744 RepID=A0A0R2DRR1_9LACO|nr:aspartate kinase [Holzapfeliella floricola]KRN03543.1 aspartate kinase [Holzapfeliella floricola DSM 23037 = JCM 16512]